MLIPKSVLQNIIQAGLSEGADFCEVYAEESLARKMILKSSQTEYLSGCDQGAGIRLFFGRQELYTHTNLLDETSLIKAVKNLAKTAQQQAQAKTRTSQEEPLIESFKSAYPSAYKENLEQQKQMLQKIDKNLRAVHSSLSQCVLTLKGVQKTVLTANSDGLLMCDFRPYHHFNVLCVAEGQGQKEMGYQSLGRAGVNDLFDEESIHKASLKAGRMALQNLTARPAPAGMFPVIINKGFGGVIFHEACGHGMETTAVADKLSVFSDKIGKKVAHPSVSAVDDGTLKGHYGFLNCDDEGQKAQKTILIEKGILKNYMADKLGAQKADCKLTGSARRESYKYPPTSRMRNTYIAPGDSSLEEMIKDVKYGLFAENLGGGSVTPETGHYNFAVTSARLIKNGRLEQPVKGASLIGNGLSTLEKITKVGQDLELSPGMCGSVSGWVPVTVGQPPILVSELTVGGHGSK